jgi:hypothetical protein
MQSASTFRESRHIPRHTGDLRDVRACANFGGAGRTDELRAIHLGATPKGKSVLAELQKAFEQAMKA